jgi:translation initiation factor IF-2
MTKESAQMIEKSGIPHVVAVTKIDIAGGSTQRVLKQLWDECGIRTTQVGGKIPAVEVSALKGIGLTDLLEQIALISADNDVLYKPRKEFNNATVQEWNKHSRSIAKSQPIQLHVIGDDNIIERDVVDIESMAQGYAYVVESKHTYGGAHLDVVVRQGSIKVGDHVVCGLEFGTVRHITSANGESVSEASGLDSTPVRILGITPEDITALGDDIIVLPSRDLAEAVALRRENDYITSEMLSQMEAENNSTRDKSAPTRYRIGRHSRALQIRGSNREHAELEAEENRTVYVSLRADVKGSLDALLSYIDGLHSSPHAHHVIVKVVKTSIGPEITKDDIDFAHTRGNVKIFAFNTKMTNKIQSYAGEQKVDIFNSNVIFDVFDEFRRLLSSKLPTTPQDTILGTALVQQIFPIQMSKIQIKKLSIEASLSISGDPVPIIGIPQVLGSRVLTGEAIRMGHGTGDLSQIYWRIKRPSTTSSSHREEVILQDLSCLSIRHFKDQVQKVIKGQECGIMLNHSVLVEVGDILECYRVKYIHEQFDDTIARGFNRDAEPDWKQYQNL